MVVAQKPTDSFPASHLGVWIRCRWRPFQQLVVESLVIPLAMVVIDVLVDDEA